MFKKYPSIENFNEKFLEKINNDNSIDKENWCILEKIHGANVQIYYDKDGFKYGKRSGYIVGSFYNAHNVLPKYEENIKNVYEYFINEPVRIFGEIFGGKYDGKYAKTKCVQKEVEYSQEIEVLFFDIMIDDKIIPYNKAIKIFEKFDIPYIKPLRICTLKEASDFPNKFVSQICEYYGLPKKEGNFCEGIVIKPFYKEYRFGTDRVILKNKNDSFKERKARKKINKLIPLTDVANNLLSELATYINENRFNAVFSKDEWDKRDFGKFIMSFAEDVKKDAEKDGILFDSVEPYELEKINKKINTEIALFCKKIFFYKV